VLTGPEPLEKKINPWGRVMVFNTTFNFQQNLSYIVVVSFIGGGNQTTRRKAIKQLIFAYWLYLLIKHCFFGGFFVANSGYFTVFTTHIYFIILIGMIAGNLVEIKLPKIQSRKCL
jgi:hypothetical protein